MGIYTPDYLLGERYPSCQGESFYNLQAGPIDEVPGLRQMYEIYMDVWDTGQQAHMDELARIEPDMVDQSASFGWCTNGRGTDAKDDATSLCDYTSLGMMG